MKKGYDMFDEAFETTSEGMSMAGLPYAAAMSAIDVAKTSVEAAVGYKGRTWSNVKDKAIDGAVNVASGLAAGGLGKAAGAVVNKVAGKTAGKAAGKIAEEMVQTGVSTGTKIVRDLNNPNDKRSVEDIILEDIGQAAARKAVTDGVKVATTRYTPGTVHGKSAPAQNNAVQNNAGDASSDYDVDDELNNGHMYDDDEFRNMMGDDYDDDNNIINADDDG